MDLSVHVESTVPDHLKTLRLKLCKEDAPDSPVHVVKLDALAGNTSVYLKMIDKSQSYAKSVFLQVESSIGATPRLRNAF